MDAESHPDVIYTY